ncbi:LamG domain-containing protein [Magnetofaba australis]|nr:LamG domain-containing protein [Magnetofaba australis]
MNAPSQRLPRRREAGFGMMYAVSVLMAVLAIASAVLLPKVTEFASLMTASKDREIMKSARDAVEGFMQQNNRLPCPSATNDGSEDCGVEVGFLPYRDIGLANGNDTVNNGLRYGVYRDGTSNFDAATSRVDLCNQLITLVAAAPNTTDLHVTSDGTNAVKNVPFLIATGGPTDADHDGADGFFDGYNESGQGAGTTANSFNEDDMAQTITSGAGATTHTNDYDDRVITAITNRESLRNAGTTISTLTAEDADFEYLKDLVGRGTEAWWQMDAAAPLEDSSCNQVENLVPTGTTSAPAQTADRHSTANSAYHFECTVVGSCDDGNSGGISGATASNGVIDGGEFLNRDGYVSIASTAIGSNDAANWTNFSYSFWVNIPTANTSTSWQTFISSGLGSINYVPNSDTMQIHIYDDRDGLNTTAANFYRESITQDLNDGNWHHIVYTVSGTGSSTSYVAYVDGSEVQNTTSMTLSDAGTNKYNDNHVWIGALDFNSTPYFPATGSIDDVRIYSKALSADEVSAIYTCENSTSCN